MFESRRGLPDQALSKYSLPGGGADPWSCVRCLIGSSARGRTPACLQPAVSDDAAAWCPYTDRGGSHWQHGRPGKHEAAARGNIHQGAPHASY